VAEALGCGLPVLISDKVNIWREIEADGAGFVAPDTLEGTRETLNRWLSTNPDQRALMVRQARLGFERRFTVDAMAHSLLEVATALARPTTPIQVLSTVSQ
jgi:glycosyltransferase involved in cell wall biosynthesis